MTNLGQIFIFSNLITIPVQGCRFWIVLLGTSHREVLMYWGLIKISKEMRMSKRGKKEMDLYPSVNYLTMGTERFCQDQFEIYFSR